MKILLKQYSNYIILTAFLSLLGAVFVYYYKGEDLSSHTAKSLTTTRTSLPNLHNLPKATSSATFLFSKPSPTSKPNQNTKAQVFIPQPVGNQLAVPILMYHYIGNNPNPSDKQRDYLSTTPTAFEEQMKYLSDNGYSTTTLDTLVAALKKQAVIPQKSVILTFDDGYEDFFHNAYPILRRFNFHATVFIPTALMNQGYYLSWAQIKEMSSSGLILFGAHTVHHVSLASLPLSGVEYELSESKKTLRDQLGVPINFVAYPFGYVDGQVIETAKKAGYIGGVGTWAGRLQSEGAIYNLPRLRIAGGISLQAFINRLNN